MKALCVGDQQIGATTVALESQEAVWSQVVDIAIAERVDAVLNGGDLMEGPLVSPEHLLAFRRPLAHLREAGIPMVLIRGNHDGAARPVDALDVFHEYDLLTVVQRPRNVEIADCVISCLPWTKRARHEDAAAQLVHIAEDLHDERPGDDRPNVLLCHWSISCASLPNGLPVADLREPVLEWADLDAIGFDAIVAAHIHKPQVLDNPLLGDATMGCYVGSPQPLNHGESGYEHGVYLLDVEPGAVSLEFLPIKSPQFVTIEMGEHLGYDLPRGAIVRYRYTATREQDAMIDKDAIRRELLAAGASRVTIEPQITREVRARVETLTHDLSAQDALAAYAEAQKTEPSVRVAMAERLAEWID